MKLLIVSALCLGFAVATASAQKTDIKTQVDSVSYSIGLDIGDNLKQQGVEVNTAVLAKGLADALSGSKRAMTPEQIQACMTEFRTQLMAKQQAKASEVGGKNKKEGEKIIKAWIEDHPEMVGREVEVPVGDSEVVVLKVDVGGLKTVEHPAEEERIIEAREEWTETIVHPATPREVIPAKEAWVETTGTKRVTIKTELKEMSK